MTDGRISVDAGRLRVDGNGRVYYNDTPVADIGASNTTPTAGDSITLYDQASDPNNDLETWDWNFDDGSTATGSGDKSHTYSSSGDYYPSLTVADVFGVSDTASVYIDVQSSAISDFEGGSLTNYSGDTGSFSVTSQTVLEGSYSLQDDGGTDHRVIVGDGFSTYGQGIQYGAYVRPEDERMEPMFGLQGSGGYNSSSVDGYGIAVRERYSDVRIRRWDNGSWTNLSTVSITLSNSDTYDLQFTWGTDDSISYDLIRLSDSTIVASDSYTDSTYTTSGYIGWHGYGTAYGDYFRTI